MKFEKVGYEFFFRDSERNGFSASKNIYNEIVLPERKTECSCGYDFCTPFNITLNPGGHVVIPTGIKAVDMPHDTALMLHVRSSVGIKKGVIFSNCTGLIDADYANNTENDGDIHLALWNTSNRVVTFLKGDRIAQGTFTRYETVTDDAVIAKRRGGIGSTNE